MFQFLLTTLAAPSLDSGSSSNNAATEQARLDLITKIDNIKFYNNHAVSSGMRQWPLEMLQAKYEKVISNWNWNVDRHFSKLAPEWQLKELAQQLMKDPLKTGYLVNPLLETVAKYSKIPGSDPVKFGNAFAQHSSNVDALKAFLIAESQKSTDLLAQHKAALRPEDRASQSKINDKQFADFKSRNPFQERQYRNMLSKLNIQGPVTIQAIENAIKNVKGTRTQIEYSNILRSRIGEFAKANKANQVTGPLAGNDPTKAADPINRGGSQDPSRQLSGLQRFKDAVYRIMRINKDQKASSTHFQSPPHLANASPQITKSTPTLVAPMPDSPAIRQATTTRHR
jgi:hypothetical protein